jgi:hypothetical protein
MTFTPTLKGEVIGNQYSLIVLVCNEDSREGRLQRLPNLKMLPQHLFPMSINSETTAPTTFISAQRKQTEAQLVTSTKEVRQGSSFVGMTIGRGFIFLILQSQGLKFSSQVGQ